MRRGAPGPKSRPYGDDPFRGRLRGAAPRAGKGAAFRVLVPPQAVPPKKPASRFRNPYALATPAFATWQGFSSASVPHPAGMEKPAEPAYKQSR